MSNNNNILYNVILHPWTYFVDTDKNVYLQFVALIAYNLAPVKCHSLIRNAKVTTLLYFQVQVPLVITHLVLFYCCTEPSVMTKNVFTTFVPDGIKSILLLLPITPSNFKLVTLFRVICGRTFSSNYQSLPKKQSKYSFIAIYLRQKYFFKVVV